MVSGQSEFIYIDIECSIKKLSTDVERKTTFFQVRRHIIGNHSVCSTNFWLEIYLSECDDIFLNIYKYNLQWISISVFTRGRVVRYNDTGRLTQVIEHNCLNYTAYIDPIHITENNNGDVVVSDRRRAVVVSNREGKHWFSYTGHPPESTLLPNGIFTDALSHILVCDCKTNAIQMLSKDGVFISFL